MTKSFFPYFSSILLLHLLVILGWTLTHSELQNVLSIGPQLMKIKVASEALLTPPKPQIRSKIQPKIAPLPFKELPAPVEQAKVPESSSSSTLSQAAKSDLRTVYISELRSRIEANKSYPLMSKRLGHTGLVVVGFTLLADGSIINIRLVSASAYERLSESALAAVEKIGRYKPIPVELGEARIDLTVPVKFSLQ